MTSIDPCVVLFTDASRVELPAGSHPVEAAEQLGAFLRKQDVTVTLDLEHPTHWEHPGPPLFF